VPEMVDDSAKAAPVGGPAGDGVESRASVPAARTETPSTQSSQKTLAMGAFGVAAVGGVVMVVAGIMTLTNDCAALGDSANCVKDAGGKGDEEKSRGDTTGLIANIGGAVMLVGGAAGAFLWFTAPKDPEKSSRVKLNPQLGLGYAGLRGTF